MIRRARRLYADMYYFEEEIAAVKAAGLRGVLGQTIIEFPVADAKTPAEGLRARRPSSRVRKATADGARRRAALDVHARCQATLLAARDLAVKYGAPLLIHLAETEDEVRISLERYGRTPRRLPRPPGFWGPHTWRRTACGSPDEMTLLHSRGVASRTTPRAT
jgi:5-methylthioadenosine/S-adenosylhomocysteine deaminase